MPQATIRQAVADSLSWTQFAELRDDWDRLRSGAGVSSVFEDWRWIEACWHHCEQHGDVEFLGIVARDDVGRPIAMLPFVLSACVYEADASCRRLQLLGNALTSQMSASAGGSTLLVADSGRVCATKAIWKALKARSDWDELVLTNVAAGCLTVPLICELARADCELVDVTDERAALRWRIDAGTSSSSIAECLAELNPLPQAAQVSGDPASDQAQIEYANRDTIDTFLETVMQWQEARPSASPSRSSNRSLLAELSRRYSDTGALRLSRMVIGGSVVSVLLSVLHEGIVSEIFFASADRRSEAVSELRAVHFGAEFSAAFDSSTIQAYDCAPLDARSSVPLENGLATPAQFRSVALRRRESECCGGETTAGAAHPVKPDFVDAVAVIIGAHSVTGYHTALALAESGVKIIGIADEAADTLFRHSRAWCTYAPNSYRPCAIVGAIAATKTEYPGRTIALFPCDDYAVEVLSEHESTLAEHAVWVGPSPKYVQRMLLKDVFYDWALGEGLRVPVSQTFSSESLATRTLVSVPKPYIVKPVVRDERWNATFPADKFLRFVDVDPTQQALDQLRALADRYVVQEWVPGDDDDIYFGLCFFDALGNCRVTVGGRKLSQWPQGGGSTAICTTECDPELLDLTRSVLSKAGMVGIGSVEFKRRNDTGEYVIIEPTVGRSDHQSLVALASGVNIPVMALHAMLGLPIGWHVPSRPALWVDDLATFRLMSSVGISRVWRLVSPRRGRTLSFARMRFSDLQVSVRFLWVLCRLAVRKVFR